MTIQRMDHAGIVVDDLEAATAFFVQLGLKLQGEGSAKPVGLTAWLGLRRPVEYAMVETPDGHGRLELIKFHAPSVQGGDPHEPANTLGIRHLAFVSTTSKLPPPRCKPEAVSSSARSSRWEIFRLCYIRGPEESSSSWRSGSAEGLGTRRPQRREKPDHDRADDRVTHVVYDVCTG